MSLLTESRLGDLRVAILEELVTARTVAFNAEVIVRRVVRSQVLDFEFTVAQAERELAELVKLSAQNLTEWRQGGYQDWKKRREQIDRTKDLADYSATLAERNGGGATQGAAAITGG